jgi:hypothetical protein
LAFWGGRILADTFCRSPGCVGGEIGDLEPGVLSDDGGMHGLNGDVAGVQMQTIHQRLKNKPQFLAREIFL